MKLFRTFGDFVNENKVNEKKHTVKRKYGHKAAKGVYEKAPLRNAIVEFIGMNKKVSETKLRKFLAKLSEQRGKNVSIGWVRNNEKLFRMSMNEDDDQTMIYSLSNFGQKVYDSLELGYQLDSDFRKDDDFDDQDAQESDWKETQVFGDDDEFEDDDDITSYVADDDDDFDDDFDDDDDLRHDDATGKRYEGQ